MPERRLHQRRRVSTYEFLMMIATIVTAIGGIGFVVIMQTTYKGQMNAQVFTECNNRYDAIASAFPAEAWEARLNLDVALPKPTVLLSVCVLRYLNLSSEEFYLYRRGYLRRDVWQIWEGEM